MTFPLLRMVFLDFDGVIVESAIVKKEAYRKLFESFPAHRDAIRAYQEESGGLPRRVQFQEIYDRILGQSLSLAQTDALERRYIDLMLDRVLKAPFVAGAEAFLETFHKKMDLYLVSATPEKELLRIIGERGVGHYFKKIFGSPPAKAEILRTLLREADCPPEESVFVGDYPTDRDAAEAVGIPFVARLGSVSEMENCTVRIADLTELPEALRRMFVLP